MLGWIIASLILIIWIYFTARLWIWVYQNAFGISSQKKIIFLSLFIWWIAAGSILLFPKIMQHLDLPSFTNYDFSYKIVFIYMWYLNLIAFLTTAILWKFSKQQLLNLFVFNLYFLLLFYIFHKFNLDFNVLNVVLYYLFVAYWEELIKNQLAFSINNKYWVVESDLLLYHILAAIGFAFWENIVYLTWTIGFQTFVVTLLGGLGIVITRWVLWFGAHTLYSSMIWIGNILGFLSIFLFILLGMLIHYWYDLSLYFNYKIVIPIFIVAMYFWITWIFYKIDRIYVEQE